ncbi:MAG TPA: alkaline phosphatase family protein [Vicinamibacteria bacterium]|nr:alkaline phosphatase family protein [Vicinamibacteria bacterium]
MASPRPGRRVAALLLLALGAGCSSAAPPGSPARRAGQRVVVMGFDGMDPILARRFMDEGKLPNLKRLAESGTFSTLASTQPSESPTAWSSFATGVNPGKHNIYDFLVRDLQTYMPDFSMTRNEPPEFLWGFFPTKPPRVISTRGGTSFWVHAGNDGVPSLVLTVPVTFPPEEIAHGAMLSGLPLPDVRGTLGTFSFWGTDLSSFEEGSAEFGGFLKRLLFEGGEARTFLKGPENPLLRQEETRLRERKRQDALSASEAARLEELATGKDINLSLVVRWTEGSGRADLEIQGQRLSLKVGEWSPWVPLTFRINALVSVHGMTQFHVVRADRELQLYASPVNFDPREEPPMPLSKPDGFAADLADALGVYRTLGWAESADKALQEGRLDEAAFLYDSDRAFDDRQRLILNALDRGDWDLLVAAVETTDRVSHMMWRLIDPAHPMYDADLAGRYGDAIEKVYRRADDLVGKVQAKLTPGAVLMVMSDHGFHSFRRGVNLNTWLTENGYMAFAGQDTVPPASLGELVGRGRFWDGVDWSRTRAYALGLGQIYFNLRGRESQGIVSEGAEYEALQDEMGAKLLALRDPDTGAPVMRAVYPRDDVYHGPYLRHAPDLQAGFDAGYRVGWQDTMGGISRAVVEDNTRKWSGDHCATAAEISGGVLFVNRKLDSATPGIMDLAPTILRLLGVPLPADLDGRPLL